jgi:hypothetical protein
MPNSFLERYRRTNQRTSGSRLCAFIYAHVRTEPCSRALACRARQNYQEKRMRDAERSLVDADQTTIAKLRDVSLIELPIDEKISRSSLGMSYFRFIVLCRYSIRWNYF